jgi:hypothetical protein
MESLPLVGFTHHTISNAATIKFEMRKYFTSSSGDDDE